MKTLYSNDLYIDDLKFFSVYEIPWHLLKDKTILLSGVSGLIGSFLADVLMYNNMNHHLNCKVVGLCRNIDKAKKRFYYWSDNDLLELIKVDINNDLTNVYNEKIDYILHLASNTHPLQYSSTPISTITTNIIGLNNMLNLAVNKKSKFLFASSNEIYGENRGDVEYFKEDYCGYIDCNTLRAGYTESKRCGEALCQAYIKEKNIDIGIVRLTRSFGPTLLEDDSKALSQFINKAINEEDIVLKSSGEQRYSYTYVSDAVGGLLTVLLRGESGEAYNVSNKKTNISLKELANLVANYVNRKVIYMLPNEDEKAGFSKATKALLDGEKLCSLGWEPKYDFEKSIPRTIEILKSIR